MSVIERFCETIKCLIIDDSSAIKHRNSILQMKDLASKHKKRVGNASVITM